MTQDNTNTNDNSLLLQRTDFKNGQDLEELKLDMSDDDLKGLIKNWLGLAAKSESVLITKGDINKAYYRGDDIRTRLILNDKSQVTDNRIFTDIETIVPLVTAAPAKPVVSIPLGQGKDKKKKEAIRSQSIKIQKLLLAINRDQKLQKKFEKIIRQSNIYRIGMFKYGISDDEIFTEAVLPSRLLLDSESVDVDDSEFIGERIVSTAKKLAKKYPDKKSEISGEVSGKMGTKITYIEWWTDEFVVRSIDSRIILDKKKNPLFDYGGDEKTTYDEFGKEMKTTTKGNVFNKPKKPYVRFSIYNIGENIIDDTTSLELSKSLQDNINDRKRQIADNADVVGNPIRTYKGMNEDQSNDADENLGAGDGVNLSDDQSIDYVQAESLPSFIQNDLQDSRNSIDNIFGIHSTSRGERQAGANESGVARESLKESDEDRQATIGRAVEEVSEELYNAFLHLIKVFYNKPQLIPVIGKNDTGEFLEARKDDVADGMKILVKPGSTIPDDPNALRAQGLELMKNNQITKRRGYEMIGMEDADEAAKELELEGVEAEIEQQKIAKEEQNVKDNENVKAGFEEQIGKIGTGQAQ